MDKNRRYKKERLIKPDQAAFKNKNIIITPSPPPLIQPSRTKHYSNITPIKCYFKSEDELNQEIYDNLTTFQKQYIIDRRAYEKEVLRLKTEEAEKEWNLQQEIRAEIDDLGNAFLDGFQQKIK